MSGFWEQGLYDSNRDHGYWSPTTASANFCEQDYAISYYVAEFINTFSNLAYFYYALYPPLISLQTKNGLNTSSTNRSTQRKGARWDVHTLALSFIGLTSGMYHLTLQRFPQFLDESAMYILIAGFAFDLLTTAYSTPSTSNQKDHVKLLSIIKSRYRSIAGWVGVAALLTASVTFLSPVELPIYGVAFAIIIGTCALRIGIIVWDMLAADRSVSAGATSKSMQVVKDYTSVTHQYRGPVGSVIVVVLIATSTFTWQTGDLTIHSITFATFILICGFKAGNMIRKHEAATKSRLYRHLLVAYMTLNVAFALWLIDCSPAWCNSLREIRQSLIQSLPTGFGTVVGFITELHGWWHILTARAAGEFTSLIRHITSNAPSSRALGDDKAQ